MLMAAGNIAVIGNDKKGMNLSILNKQLLQIFDERNHKRHCDILFVHSWRICDRKRH